MFANYKPLMPELSYTSFLPQNQLPQTTAMDLDIDLDATPSLRLPRAEPLKSGEEEKAADEGGHGGDKMTRYPLSSVDFGRVKTPFIIGIWILSASIAKIGECFF